MSLNIKIVIAGVSYPIEVEDTQEEQAMRIAAQKVNDLVFKFQQDFEEIDRQKALSMAALLFAYNSGLSSLQDEEERIKELKTIKDLTKLIDKHL